MSLEGAIELARREQLYPSVILHGGTAEDRQAAAVELARALLCQRDAPERPCGTCRHCRRIAWPEAKGTELAPFHPDFQVLERDLKTSTSVGAVKELLKTAQVSPFEARGQAFAVASAESLSGEAANALLKSLEEPHTSAPRLFLLLAPSQFDLLPTLRSRSMPLYLGPAEALDEGETGRLAERLAPCLAAFAASGATVHLLAAAGVLAGIGGYQDARAGRPWAVAARAVVAALEKPEVPAALRRRGLALAEALLGGPAFRLRGVPAERVLEGLVVRHLAVETAV